MFLQKNEYDYARSISRLLKMAEGVTSGGRVAAQVLLSTYNGENYHLDATDLCILDHKDLEAAMMVLAQRVLTSKEPHTMDETFPDKFDQLEVTWHFLNIRERYGHKY